jgi:hypothetical protein
VSDFSFFTASNHSMLACGFGGKVRILLVDMLHKPPAV